MSPEAEPAAEENGSAGPGAPIDEHVQWISALAAAAAVVWQFDVASGVTPIGLMNHDLFTEFFPRHSYFGTAIAEGRLPLWDPHQIAGLPFLATLQAGALYPPNLLYALIPTGIAMGALGVIHVMLAGAFTYLLAREFGRSGEAASLAGLTYMLGGSTLFLAFHTNAINSAPWLPAALLFTVRATRSGELRDALGLAASMALLFLAGRDYTFVITAYAVTGWAVFLALSGRRNASGRPGFGRLTGLLALAAGLAAGLAAAQILPTLSLAADSARPLSGVDPAVVETFGPMPPALFLANLVNPLRGSLRREYVGFIPLLCFLFAFRLWGRDRVAVLASGTAVVSLLLVFGSQTPLYGVFRALPLGASFRLPDRFVVLFALAVAIGASCGFDTLLERARHDAAAIRDLAKRALLPGAAVIALAVAIASGWLDEAAAATNLPWGWFWFYELAPDHFSHLGVAIVYAILAAAALAGAGVAARRGRRQAAALALLLLTLVDLAVAQDNPLMHPSSDPEPVFAGRECYAAAAPLLGAHGRHLSFGLRDSYGIKDKDGQLYGTYSATHYDPLVTQRHVLYFNALQFLGRQLGPVPRDDVFMGFLARAPRADRVKLVDLLGVEAVLVSERPERASIAVRPLIKRMKEGPLCKVQTANGLVPVRIYRNPRALPRAFAVRVVEEVSSPKAAINRLVSPSFAPSMMAIVEPRPGSDDFPLPPIGEITRFDDIEIVDYAAERVEIRADLAAPGLLVLTDTFTPDWTASVDGEPVAIHPTDALFRGVVLPRGESRVVFRYEPRSFSIGAGISGGALALFAGLWWRSSRRSSEPEHRE